MRGVYRGFDANDLGLLIAMHRQQYTVREIAKAMNRPIHNVRWKLGRIFGKKAAPGELGKPCLRCRSPFIPEHKFNRMCKRCNAYAAHTSSMAI